MSEMLDTLHLYFEFPTVRYAFIVGLLIALCASLLGVTLVMKRFSFIGDGLSHVAFGAMAVASVLGVTNNMFIIMPITIVSAVLLLRTGQSAKIKGDAAVAMISVGALAIGYLLMNLAPKNGGSTTANISADVCSTLFGSTSILTLSITDVWLCVGMSVAVIAVFLAFYHKIFAVTFDESFAKATGVRADLYNLLIAVVIAVIIFPALSAMWLFKSFKSVIICSVIFSLICAGAGLIISILAGTPVGATIVAADIAVFFIFSGISLAVRK